jgi:signal transduction histidine kinase
MSLLTSAATRITKGFISALSLLFLLCSFDLFAADTTPLPTLTTASEIRRLSTAEAAKAYPVKLRGVITYQAVAKTLMFLQDETGGVYISPDFLASPLNHLEPGTSVELSGVTYPGSFAPYVGGMRGRAVECTILGPGQLPEPLWLTPDELLAPRYHSQWVELRGVVRQMQYTTTNDSPRDELSITVGSSAGRFAAVLYGKDASVDPSTNLIGAQVRMRGVYGSIFNEKRQLVGMRLFVNSRRDILVDRPGGEDPFAFPLQPIATLMQFDASPAPVHSRRLVQGRVTLVVGEDGFYMEDASAGLWVQSVARLKIQPGDTIEVAGFPAWGEWNPVIEDAQVRALPGHELPLARNINPSQALSGEYCFRRVQIEAQLLQPTRHTQQPTLVLQSDNRVFLARFASPENAIPLSFEEGSRLQLTGICINQPDPLGKPSTPPWIENLVKRPATFYLLIGSASDVVLLSPPPWWTAPRLLLALAVLLAVLLAAGLWAFLLRRQVHVKTEIIRQQMNKAAIHEERERIARELHDSLEQEMTGVVMHLDAAAATLEKSPPATRRSLETARALLDHSRVEARQSIWELRSTALEQGGLVAAFDDLVQSHSSDAGPRVETQMEGTPFRLPPKVESHLLRIAREALTNAIKHSRATRAVLRLVFDPKEVILSIKDDGIGFDVANAAGVKSGHFGILGMKERAGKIQGAFDLQSAPGQGTEIKVVVRTATNGKTPS